MYIFRQMQLSRFIIRLDFPYDPSAVLLYPKIDSIIIQNVNLVIDNLNDEIYSLKFNIEMKVKATFTSPHLWDVSWYTYSASISEDFYFTFSAEPLITESLFYNLLWESVLLLEIDSTRSGLNRRKHVSSMSFVRLAIFEIKNFLWMSERWP